MGNVFNRFFSAIKDGYCKLKSNPKEFFVYMKKRAKEIFFENKMFILFIVLNVLNAFLLRLFTLKDLNDVIDIRTLMADTAFVVIVGSFGHFIKGRAKVQIGVCKGKKNYDKRESIKERDLKRLES